MRKVIGEDKDQSFRRVCKPALLMYSVCIVKRSTIKGHGRSNMKKVSSGQFVDTCAVSVDAGGLGHRCWQPGHNFSAGRRSFVEGGTMRDTWGHRCAAFAAEHSQSLSLLNSGEFW